MGYRVQYSPEKDGRYPMEKLRGKWFGKGVAAALAVLVLIGIISTRTTAVRDFLLPGDPEYTLQALDTLAEDIKSGEPAKEAVTEFCSRIMEHAQIV